MTVHPALNLLLTLLAGTAMLAAAMERGQPPGETLQVESTSTRRNDLSNSSAKPLDATQFSQHPTDYVAYALAGRIPTVLAKQPCFCPCHFIHHHRSLLDCFAGLHGRECGICKQEAIFCYEQQRQGKSRRQIR